MGHRMMILNRGLLRPVMYSTNDEGSMPMVGFGAGFTSLEFLRIRGGCFEPVEGPHG